MDQKEKEIIEQVVQLFTRFGIKSITMDEISRQTAMSKKTLYQYFSDKNELVEKAVCSLIAQNSCIIKAIEDKQLNAIEELFEVYHFVNNMVKAYNPVLEFDLQRYFPAIFKKVRERHRTDTCNLMLSNLKKGKAEGLYRKEMDEEIIAKLNLMRIEYMMQSDLITQADVHSSSFTLEIFKYHIYGIISKAGWNYLKENYPEFVNN
ncbi:MAG: TetR/AcrR family transcriptional regulator [Bacteroidales bacterium]|jgi:AcrR family transcriptional regulator|nr:TetR/AcrR family transcriptional regulator [Bacteroidales bacterium]MDY0084335.1 TetR/AcrR family transcriptional regulator [Bacteroidales bacterium]